jgi:hypothetical protein
MKDSIALMFWPGGVTFNWKGNTFEESHAICAVVLFGSPSLSVSWYVQKVPAIQREERLRDGPGRGCDN